MRRMGLCCSLGEGLHADRKSKGPRTELNRTGRFPFYNRVNSGQKQREFSASLQDSPALAGYVGRSVAIVRPTVLWQWSSVVRAGRISSRRAEVRTSTPPSVWTGMPTDVLYERVIRKMLL